jgi:hypothetical protein
MKVSSCWKSENLVGDVCNPRKRSHPGTADREERLNKAPQFPYRYDTKNTKTALCAASENLREPEKKHFYCQTCTDQPAMCTVEKISHSQELQKALVQVA